MPPPPPPANDKPPDKRPPGVAWLPASWTLALLSGALAVSSFVSRHVPEAYMVCVWADDVPASQLAHGLCTTRTTPPHQPPNPPLPFDQHRTSRSTCP
jgi:hypothetical protein